MTGLDDYRFSQTLSIFQISVIRFQILYQSTVHVLMKKKEKQSSLKKKKRMRQRVLIHIQHSEMIHRWRKCWTTTCLRAGRQRCWWATGLNVTRAPGTCDESDGPPGPARPTRTANPSPSRPVRSPRSPKKGRLYSWLTASLCFWLHSATPPARTRRPRSSACATHYIITMHRAIYFGQFIGPVISV